MKDTKKNAYEPGTPEITPGLHIDITADGPYLV